MRIDGPLLTPALPEVPAAARAMEAAGYDGAFTFEGPHDPFLPLVLAADATERLELTTAVAIAFARSPMTLAAQAWDLQAALARSLPPRPGQPDQAAHRAALLDAVVGAGGADARAGPGHPRDLGHLAGPASPLRFEGEHYTHTLMTPFFDPGPLDVGSPPVWLGGVGPRMTEVAGEVADGFMVHPFCTERSLLEVTLPALERGRARPGAVPTPIQLSLPGDDRHRAGRRRHGGGHGAVRAQIAFYGSTPAYKVVLDVHGWGDLQPTLRDLTRAGDWGAMAELVHDELLEAVAVVGPTRRRRGRDHPPLRIGARPGRPQRPLRRRPGALAADRGRPPPLTTGRVRGRRGWLGWPSSPASWRRRPPWPARWRRRGCRRSP